MESAVQMNAIPLHYSLLYLVARGVNNTVLQNIVIELGRPKGFFFGPGRLKKYC